jgi:DNA-binding NtrC family response regulator
MEKLVQFNKTILIVEDNSDLLKIYGEAFNKLFSKVLVACNGQEAKKIIDDEWIDIIITDMNMPNGNGMMVIDEAIKFKVPTIVISAHGELMGTCTMDECIICKQKPINIRHLIPVIEELLKKSEDKECYLHMVATSLSNTRRKVLNFLAKFERN